MTTKPDGSTEASSSKQNSSFPKAATEQRNRPRTPPIQTGTLYAQTTIASSKLPERQHWFVLNTFAPHWLPRPMRHAYVGYVIGVVLQVIATIFTVLLMHLFPSYLFTGLSEILFVAITALYFGTGPSLLSTLVGIVLINLTVLSHRSFYGLGDVQSFTESIFFLLVGIIISIVASQVERARRSAIDERNLLDALIETVPDSVSLFDVQEQLVHLNSAGRRLADERGIHYPTFAETTGRLRTPKGRFFQQEDLPVRRALQGEKVTSVEMVWAPVDGEKEYFMVSAAPMYDATKQIVGVVSISHDVSALRRSEQAMVASASELRAIFESITDGVVVLNPQGLVLHANSAFREMMGLPTDTKNATFSLDSQQMMLPIFNTFNEQGQQLAFEELPQNRILRGETLTDGSAVEVTIQAPNGQELLVSVYGAPVTTKSGKLVGGVAVYRNITERKRLEMYTKNAFRVLLEMAQTLLQDDHAGDHAEHLNTPVGQRLVELTSRVLGCERVGIISISPKTERLLPVAIVGLSPEQERQWWTSIPELYLKDLVNTEQIAQLSSSEVVLQDSEHYKAMAQQYGQKNILLAPMHTDRELVGLLTLDYGRADDVYTSDDKTLVGTIAKLVALVLERERLLRERAEARGNEIALRESNDRMNEFLGIASHELKTPITTIKGSAQLLERRLKKLFSTDIASVAEREHLQSEMQDLLRRSNIQVNRLTRLINDLLDISRIQANSLEPYIERANLVTVLRDVVQEQRHSTPRRTIELSLPEEQDIFIFVDVDRIEQVITNYISNALKYSSADKPINVSLQIQEAEVFVRVKDEGPGLPKEVQANVFDRFYRVKGIEVKSGSGIGLGLGLYICKTIIELHRGQVGVESELGQGSTFWFSLPFVK